MKRIVELVEDRRGEDPSSLVAFDLLQPRPEHLRARRGLFGDGELRAQAKVVSADAEETSDEDRESSIHDRVRARERL